MLPIQISEEDRRTIQSLRFTHPDPHVQRKMEALWLKSHQLPHHLIAQLTGVCENTLRCYLRAYAEGGLAQVQQQHYPHPQSALQPHAATLEASFRERPPASINEALTRIEQLTGIRRQPTQVRQFLKSLGLKRLKVGTIPAKADTEEQQRFLQEELEPRLAEARQEQRAMFFVDAAHFVLQPFLGYLWCFVRIFIRAPAGRKRFNVLAALQAITHQVVTVTNDTYINAVSVCDLLRQIAAQNLGVPITLVLDNARYQKCALVQELAKVLQIELLFLPSYSPNLNLIERLWKFVKKTCLYSKYYEDFPSFQEAIQTCLSQTQTKHHAALTTLLTLRFQTFEKPQNFRYPDQAP